MLGRHKEAVKAPFNPHIHEYAAILAHGIEQSTPNRIFGDPHRALSLTEGYGAKPIAGSGRGVRLGYADGVVFDIPWLRSFFPSKDLVVNQKMMRVRGELSGGPEFGLRIGTSTKIINTQADIERALMRIGEKGARDEVAPALFSMAMRYGKLTHELLRAAEDVKAFTVVETLSSDGTKIKREIYFPWGDKFEQRDQVVRFRAQYDSGQEFDVEEAIKDAKRLINDKEVSGRLAKLPASQAITVEKKVDGEREYAILTDVQGREYHEVLLSTSPGEVRGHRRTALAGVS